MKTHKLIQLQSSHNNLRTTEIEGWFNAEPEKGKSFVFYSDPLDPTKSLRRITTSKVEEISVRHGGVIAGPKTIEFRTQNSIYMIKELSENRPEA